MSSAIRSLNVSTGSMVTAAAMSAAVQDVEATLPGSAVSGIREYPPSSMHMETDASQDEATVQPLDQAHEPDKRLQERTSIPGLLQDTNPGVPAGAALATELREAVMGDGRSLAAVVGELAECIDSIRDRLAATSAEEAKSRKLVLLLQQKFQEAESLPGSSTIVSKSSIHSSRTNAHEDADRGPSRSPGRGTYVKIKCKIK